MAKFEVGVLCFFVVYTSAGQDTYCGTLAPLVNIVEEGTSVNLKFQTNTTKTVTWQRHTQTGFQNIVDDQVFDIVTLSDFRHFLYILGYKARYTDSGVYRVKCGNTFSNTVNVTIAPKPPSKPEFVGTVNNSFCQNCVPALVGKEVHVACYTDGGSEPVNIRMLKNEEEIKRNLDMYGPTSTGERRVRYVFIPQAEEVNPVFSCSVKNPAVAVELVSSIIIYTYIFPKIIQISGAAVREDESSVIQCVTQGGRPSLQPFFIIKYRQQNVSIKTDIPTGSTFTVTSSITRTFNRFENNATIQCCVDMLSEINCTADRLKVTFSSIEIEVREVRKNNSNNGDTYLELECATGPSNPVSRVMWFGVEDGKRNLLNERNGIDKNTSGTTLTTVMSFHLNRNHNGQKISCSAENPEYPDYRVTSTYTLNITYEPVVSIQGPENLTAYVGENVTLTCRVDSNPVSMIFWKNETTAIKDISGGSLALTLDSITMDDEQTYICVARNTIGGFKSKTVNLIVKDRHKLEDKGNFSLGELIGTAVATAVVVVVAVFIGIAFFTITKRKNVKAQCSQPQADLHRTDPAHIEDPSHCVREQKPAKKEPFGGQADRMYGHPRVGHPEYVNLNPEGQRLRDINNCRDYEMPGNNGEQHVYAEVEM